MEAYIDATKQKVRISFSGKLSELLKRLKISQETVIVVRNKTIITEDEILKDTDSVRILSVVSGG